ncbi:hypothetical protein OV203_41020 [Nannocystis sp. ILAH1]|uniref:hypothetical protein n=1 Tax=unclassified Nannocystis TaxID=2627009 RepID=UPI00226FE345|nr:MULTISPECIES: hypothetical protein [unclassified Nannocystis]MCY0993592.1 hypothetical protein [Nannocystis sp. ILAH1]MCY1063681.1 hypothetical protein [Nannocystis sp. RBIL2]
MPTPKLRRDLVLKTGVAAGPVANLDIDLNASFTTELTGTTIKWEDESSSDPEEQTKFKMSFLNVGGANVGALTIKLVGNPCPDVPATVTKTARQTTDPTATTGTVTLLDPADDTFERVWRQAVNNSRVQVVDNVAKIDIRAKAEAGYVVNQAVGTATDNSLIVNYAFVDATGTAVVSGSVRFDTSSTASAGYTLGNVRVVDTDSGASARRR